jgi:O-antigen/teichoic acid export membrane protein
MGGVALVSTFIGLLATSLLSSGFKIHGIGAWLFATVIVWVASLIAMLILPLIILKDVVDDADRRRRGRR